MRTKELHPNLFTQPILIQIILLFLMTAPIASLAESVSCPLIHGPRPYNVIEALKSKGWNPTLLRFSLDDRSSGPTSIGFRLNVSVEDDLLGGITILREENTEGRTPVYHVASTLIYESKFRRRGLGILLYFAAAKILFEKTGEALHSTGAPSTDARRLWHMMIKNGWVDPFIVNGLEWYKFRTEVLQTSFANEVLQFVQKSITP